MDSSKEGIIKLLNDNRAAVEMLVPYMEWLKSNIKTKVMGTYGDDGVAENSVSFPVYDSTLLNFVKTCNATGKMDRNYVYTLSRNRLKTANDEIRFIQNATLYQAQDIWNIVARYILKGATKGPLWAEGVTNGVYYEACSKLKELVEFWDTSSKL